MLEIDGCSKHQKTGAQSFTNHHEKFQGIDLTST